MRWMPSFITLGSLLLGSMACDRPANTGDRRTPEEKTDRAAHQVGEDAYKATQKAKEATKRAVDEVKKAGREVRDGWEDAKRHDPDAQHTSK
ncbi:MAG TPA: hypothetical protein VL127_19170 [Bryobacteraceae bacterium]|jgi:hypothetical protein|nr:hypothetical protein [Bryobacteraceae bacterium]